VKAHTGAALCSVEVTDGPSTRGPPADPPGEGVGSLAMQPSPVSQPSRTWLFERLSMEVGVDPGLNLVSCRHFTSVAQQLPHQILSMCLRHTHWPCVSLPGDSLSSTSLFSTSCMRSVEGVQQQLVPKDNIQHLQCKSDARRACLCMRTCRSANQPEPFPSLASFFFTTMLSTLCSNPSQTSKPSSSSWCSSAGSALGG